VIVPRGGRSRRTPSVLALVAAASLAIGAGAATGAHTSIDACMLIPRSGWVATFGTGQFIQSLDDPSYCNYAVGRRSLYNLDVSEKAGTNTLASARAAAKRLPRSTFRSLPGLGAGAFISYGRGPRGNGLASFLLVTATGRWIVTVAGASPSSRAVPPIVRFAKQARARLSTTQ